VPREAKEDVPSDKFNGILVGDINDSESVFVVIETDLMFSIGRVRTMVHHTLSIMSVTVVRVAT
jgi:hypothetical protein